MITLIIALLTLAVYGFIIHDLCTDRWRDFGIYMLALLGISATTLISGLILAAAFGIGQSSLLAVEVNRKDAQYSIYSLRNTDNISGSFFLGSGRIDSNEYYYMFAKNERGGYIRSKLPVNSCSLYQDSDTPYVRYQLITFRQNKWVSFIPFEWVENSSYDIHVPANTIIEKYEVK